MDMALINGLINVFLSVKVLITLLMDWVDMSGLMEDHMKVNTQTIQNMASVFTHGQTGKSIEAVGKMGNSMVLELTFISMSNPNK
jgi:hypothetical protein